MKKTPQDKTDAHRFRPEFSEDEILQFQLLKMKKKPGVAPWYREHQARIKRIPHGLVLCRDGPFDGYSIDVCTEHGSMITLPFEHKGEIGRYENGGWKVLMSADELKKRRAELAGQPAPAYVPPASLLQAAERAQKAERAARAAPAPAPDPAPAPAPAPAATRRRPAVKLDPAAQAQQDARPAPGQAAPADRSRHLWRLKHDPAYAAEWAQARPADPTPPADPAPEPAHQDARPAVIWRAPLLSIPEHLRHV